MTKIKSMDSTREDTPIQSNFIIRMFINLIRIMAFISLTIGIVNHCHLSRVFERASDGNYYIYLTKASMSNQLSAELATEINAASTDQFNQCCIDSSANEPQNNHAQAQVDSNTQFNPGVHGHQNSKSIIQGGNNQKHPNQSNSIAANGSNITPQIMRANSQIEIMKNKKLITSIDEPAHQNTSKGIQPIIQGGADNNIHSKVDMAQLNNNLHNNVIDEDDDIIKLNSQENTNETLTNKKNPIQSTNDHTKTQPQVVNHSPNKQAQQLNTLQQPTKDIHHVNKSKSKQQLLNSGAPNINSNVARASNYTNRPIQTSGVTNLNINNKCHDVAQPNNNSNKSNQTHLLYL